MRKESSGRTSDVQPGDRRLASEAVDEPEGGFGGRERSVCAGAAGIAPVAGTATQPERRTSPSGRRSTARRRGCGSLHETTDRCRPKKARAGKRDNRLRRKPGGVSAGSPGPPGRLRAGGLCGSAGAGQGATAPVHLDRPGRWPLAVDMAASSHIPIRARSTAALGLIP
jgi:hypothetical protein